MRIHLDPTGGVAGDMFVAALLDALPELADRVLADAALVLGEEYHAPTLTPRPRGGVRAMGFGLPPRVGSLQDHDRAHDHAEPDGRVQPHDHQRAGSFAAMVHRIRSVPLAAGTAEHAIAILTILAEAEARIHGVPVDDVHFHEIGDDDSLMDVVAAGSICAALAAANWSCGAVPTGGGTVRSAHGLLPVPAPATLEILRDFHWVDDGIGGERVTPTGAAILRHLIDPAAHGARGVLIAAGYGSGTRELSGCPNVLRASVFREERPAGSGTDRVAVIDFDIDDMTGEELAVAQDRLRELAGVLDVSSGQRVGKKGRSVTSIRILVSDDEPLVAQVAAACFAQTSTLGIRLHRQERQVLAREHSVAHLPDGAVRVKRAQRAGAVTVKAEHDDLWADTLAERRRTAAAAEGAGS